MAKSLNSQKGYNFFASDEEPIDDFFYVSSRLVSIDFNELWQGSILEPEKGYRILSSGITFNTFYAEEVASKLNIVLIQQRWYFNYHSLDENLIFLWYKHASFSIINIWKKNKTRFNFLPKNITWWLKHVFSIISIGCCMFIFTSFETAQLMFW